jgi:cytochrome c
MLRHTLTAAAAACAFFAGGAQAQVDEEAAQALAKKSGCFKCHAVDRKKDGPSFQTTAAKYKDKADAVDHLVKHVTTRPTIEVEGEKEEHVAVKTTDAGEIKNLVNWILSR